MGIFSLLDTIGKKMKDNMDESIKANAADVDYIQGELDKIVTPIYENKDKNTGEYIYYSAKDKVVEAGEDVL